MCSWIVFQLPLSAGDSDVLYIGSGIDNPFEYEYDLIPERGPARARVGGMGTASVRGRGMCEAGVPITSNRTRNSRNEKNPRFTGENAGFRGFVTSGRLRTRTADLRRVKTAL